MSTQVEAGANVGAYNKDGLTAIDIAASRKHLLVQCYLQAEGARSSAEFWDAADKGKVLFSDPFAPYKLFLGPFRGRGRTNSSVCRVQIFQVKLYFKYSQAAAEMRLV